MGSMKPVEIDFLSKCLHLDPEERHTASQLLKHEYFSDLHKGEDNIDETLEKLAYEDSKQYEKYNKPVRDSHEESIFKLAGIFAEEERLLDLNGELQRKIERESEPDVKLSSLDH